jgi:hypothetical protein
LGIRGRVARGRLALFLFVVVNRVVGIELIGVEAELFRLEDGHEKVLALGVMRLHELLVDLVDDLLQLVVGEIDLQEERAVDLEATVVKIDPPDAAGAAVDREDLA